MNDEKGKVVHFDGIVYDITQGKRNQDKLKTSLKEIILTIHFGVQ